MGGLTNILGGAAITVASSAAVEAQINILNFAELLTPKNPSARQDTGKVDSNLGETDSRRPVYPGEKAYESVLSLNGDSCTGTIVDIEGYKPIEGGTLVVTAAHCVDESDPTGIYMNGNYLDANGNVQRFFLQSNKVWVHPFHGDFNRNSDPGTIDSRADIALIYSKSAIPEDVLKAEFVPTDFDKILEEAKKEIAEQGISLEEAAKNYQEDPDKSQITSAGFSNDVIGLHVHENANVLGLSASQVIMSDIDDAQGASGGPTYLAGENGDPLQFNEKGQPQVIAVNSAGDEVTEDTPKPENAYSTALKPEFLETVPFLSKEDNEVCLPQTAEVVAPSGINMRYGADTSFEKLVRDQNGPSGVPWGSQITIHDRIENVLGEKWALATSLEGRTGYVAEQNLKIAPEFCLKF